MRRMSRSNAPRNLRGAAGRSAYWALLPSWEAPGRAGSAYRREQVIELGFNNAHSVAVIGWRAILLRRSRRAIIFRTTAAPALLLRAERGARSARYLGRMMFACPHTRIEAAQSDASLQMKE